MSNVVIDGSRYNPQAFHQDELHLIYRAPEEEQQEEQFCVGDVVVVHLSQDVSLFGGRIRRVLSGSTYEVEIFHDGVITRMLTHMNTITPITRRRKKKNKLNPFKPKNAIDMPGEFNGYIKRGKAMQNKTIEERAKIIVNAYDKGIITAESASQMLQELYEEYGFRNDRVHPKTNKECPNNSFGHILRKVNGFRFDYYGCIHCTYKLEMKS